MATDVQDFLEQSKLFAGAERKSAIKELAACSKSIFLEQGQELFLKGDDADFVYLIVSGEVVASSSKGKGKDTIAGLLRSKDILGEMSLFDNKGRSANAWAVTSVELIAIPNEDIRDFYDKNPECMLALIKVFVARVRASNQIFQDMVRLDTPGRTAKRLLNFSRGKDKFQLNITQETLAGLVGATREGVNKALSNFQDLGWLRIEDRTYIIIDRKKLTERAS